MSTEGPLSNAVEAFGALEFMGLSMQATLDGEFSGGGEIQGELVIELPEEWATTSDCVISADIRISPQLAE